MKNKTIAIVGHAGIGHVNGISGFVQDDSAGFITVGSMLVDLLGADTRIELAEADIHTNRIRIVTRDGGSSMTRPRREITPAEVHLIKSIEGKDALFCQQVVINCFGRIYGQGVMETPVALQAALANAVVHTFHQKAPETFAVTEESIPINSGLIGGIKKEIEGFTLAYMLSVNYSSGGIGPVEDLEGNVPLGSKGLMMKAMNMLPCPTIILESKAYLPSISDTLDQNTFLIRAQREMDNTVVGNCLLDAAAKLGYPVMFRDDMLPASQGTMKKATTEFADTVIAHAQKLKSAAYAAEKVAIVADMAKLISQDAGAVTCMSDTLHDIVRATGSLPGTSAVLSMLVSRKYMDHWKIPLFGEQDAHRTRNIVQKAVEKLMSVYDDAWQDIYEYYVDIID